MYEAKNKKDEVGQAYSYSLPWRIFAHRINKSEYMRDVLFSDQASTCPVCEGSLDSDFVLHHVDYAHVCQFGVEIEIPTGKVSSRTGKMRVHNVPDCRSCQAARAEFFESCKSRLILVHRQCHGSLHKQSMLGAKGR